MAGAEILALDLQGTLVSIVQIIALLLLIIGVYPYRIRTKNRNLIIHGFLSILAISLNLATVFSVMVPTFGSSLDAIATLPILQATVVWVHVATGIAAIAMGLVIIVSWVTHPLGELGCAKTWKLMIPTFIIWAVALVLGLIIHIFNIV